MKHLPSTNSPFVPQLAQILYCSAGSGTRGRLLSTSAWVLTSTRNHILLPRVAKYVHHNSRGSRLLINIHSSSVAAVAENPVVSRSKQLRNSHTVIHLVFLCPDRLLYAARVESFNGSLVMPTHSNKICMHKYMQALHVHFYLGHRPGNMISSIIYDRFFSASRKTASTGMTVGGTPGGVPGPLGETLAAFVRRTRSAWWLFSQAAPPP